MTKSVIMDGIVINIIEYDEGIGIRGLRLRRDQILVDSSLYAVKVGDEYINNTFMRNGEPVPFIDDVPTYEEMEEALNILGVGVGDEADE